MPTTSAETKNVSVKLYGGYFQTCNSKSRCFELKSIYCHCCHDTTMIVAACFACSKSTKIQNASLHTPTLDLTLYYLSLLMRKPLKDKSVRDVCVRTFSLFIGGSGVQDLREAFLEFLHLLYLSAFEAIYEVG